MGYVIVDKKTQKDRIRTVNAKGEAELTPFFYTSDEAMWWIKKRLHSSHYVTLKKVGDDTNGRK